MFKVFGKFPIFDHLCFKSFTDPEHRINLEN